MRLLPAPVLLALVSLACSSGSGEEAAPPVDAETNETSSVEDSAAAEVPLGDDTGTVGETGTDATIVEGATEPNLKVAFVGDQGTNANTLVVLNLIKKEGAQFVVLLGDFDYEDDPAQWEGDLVAGLGAEFPVFGVIGNHDEARWAVTDGYKSRLTARLAKIAGAKCTGEYGVKSLCTYKGLSFILSGAGTLGTGHDTFIKDQLAADKSIWRVCAWHKNMADMQIGDKGDEAGWGPYQACQNGGALVMTGHEHSYARTKTLTALGNRAAGHGATGAFDKLVVKAGSPGSTFVTVSGLGGTGIRDYVASKHDDDTWWASYWGDDTALKTGVGVHLKNGVKLTTNAGYGVTFVTFNVDGDPHKARGYVKSTGGVEIDSYEIRRE